MNTITNLLSFAHFSISLADLTKLKKLLDPNAHEFYGKKSKITHVWSELSLLYKFWNKESFFPFNWQFFWWIRKFNDIRHQLCKVEWMTWIKCRFFAIFKRDERFLRLFQNQTLELHREFNGGFRRFTESTHFVWTTTNEIKFVRWIVFNVHWMRKSFI